MPPSEKVKPICLELRSLALSKLGYTLTCSAPYSAIFPKGSALYLEEEEIGEL